MKTCIGIGKRFVAALGASYMAFVISNGVFAVFF